MSYSLPPLLVFPSWQGNFLEIISWKSLSEQDHNFSSQFALLHIRCAGLLSYQQFIEYFYFALGIIAWLIFPCASWFFLDPFSKFFIRDVFTFGRARNRWQFALWFCELFHFHVLSTSPNFHTAFYRYFFPYYWGHLSFFTCLWFLHIHPYFCLLWFSFVFPSTFSTGCIRFGSRRKPQSISQRNCNAVEILSAGSWRFTWQYWARCYFIFSNLEFRTKLPG